MPDSLLELFLASFTSYVKEGFPIDCLDISEILDLSLGLTKEVSLGLLLVVFTGESILGAAFF